MSRQSILLAIAATLLLWTSGPGPGPVPLIEGDEVFLYRGVQKVKPGHLPLNQSAIGSCVAFGNGGVIDANDANAYLQGRIPKWLPSSKESLYGGMRNEGAGRISHSRSDGSSGFAAVRWLKNYGVLYETHYKTSKAEYDLTKYNVPRCKEWGAEGNGGREDGMNGPLDEEAKKHPVQSARISTLEELDAALFKLGKGVAICSGVGFSSPRDKDGFCAPRGGWSHCMAVLGKRNGGRPGYLIQNSWGKYITGDGENASNKYKDQPDGSFYIEPAHMQRILNAGDSWVLLDTDGFKRCELPDWLTDPNGIAPETEAERDARVFQGDDGLWHFRDGEKHFINRSGQEGDWVEFDLAA